MSNDNASTDEGQGGDNLAELRAAADRAKAVPALEKQIAFLKAGINTDTRLGGMFLDSYKGELTIEAIRAEATEIGAWKPPTTEQTPPAGEAAGQQPPPSGDATTQALLARNEEQRQQILRDQVAQGQNAGATPTPAGDPYDEAMGNFHLDRKKGMTMENAGYAAIDRILMRASEGDKAVMLDESPRR